MCKKVISIFTVLFFGEIQTQLCNYDGSIQQMIPNPSTFPFQDLLASTFNMPQIPYALVDSSVSNNLADTLQLIIVSDVIASSLNPCRTISQCARPAVSPICKAVPTTFTPTVEYVPRIDFIPPPCAPVVDILQSRYPCIEPLPNLNGVADILSLAANGASVCPSGVIPVNANLSPTFGSVYVKETSPMASLSPCYCNGLPELLGPVAEIMYPPKVQPCNAGCASPPVTITNFNLEPIPYTGVNYFY